MITALAPALTFDEVAHRYFLAGRELPSVTTVLKDAGRIDATWFTEDSRQRGSYVHQAAHYLDQDDLAEESVDPRYAGYVQAYRRFLTWARPVWTFVEHRVCDETYGYAGTLDRAGCLQHDGRHYIVDIKSCVRPASVGIQTAAYRRCLPDPHTWRRAALVLKDDGNFVFEELTDRRDEARFLADLERWYWKREYLR